MSQDEVILLCFKVAIIADIVSVAAFIAVYWRLAPWWRNPIGRTLVTKDILLILLLVPSLLSLFFRFNRLTSHIAAWVDVGLFALLTPAMLWRVAVFERIHKRNNAAAPEDETEA